MEEHDEHWHDTDDNFKAFSRLIWLGFFLIGIGLGVYVWSAS